MGGVRLTQPEITALHRQMAGPAAAAGAKDGGCSIGYRGFASLLGGWTGSAADIFTEVRGWRGPSGSVLS